ncbi:hypothetical protein BW723_01875 [Polaribacter reichenbachii]|uniref:AAA domain-containing protein n=1 Tax=Polaribacter reichenbachii TaxID=996801 RepID=A0A1B8TW40_9FLAO|nr:AAA family ATPase [Polaribacter reichenbachii]APZ45118.1 hypothetical protein BW723_01875 [Polaribacter reichenbachii]AUC18980.1 hypothetical protein BTO17_09875 [Polaribacter reichenbachii]OBY63863.1 hypothetical protein LPB301_13825 [Polaribacter reichenbachii]
MTIVDFIRLILKHIVLLITVPILLGVLVILLTMKPSFEYSSETLLYTGLATGSSIEMDKTFNYQATNSAFDNLINIIKSRETQEEVAIRLLALHLMLPEANPKYISEDLFKKFQKKIPKRLYNYVAKEDVSSDIQKNIIGIDDKLFPDQIDRNKYEKTVENLTALMKSSNDNYVYELLNYDEDDHYSLKAISSLSAQRINSSDLIKLSYTVNDPGICQQTLAIYNTVCIKNYKNIKENRSDAVVKYFQNELKKARVELKNAEDKLLEFNKSSKIINYYEQSKAVAVVKEDMDVDYKKNIAELAGLNAGIRRLEKKLEIQEIIQEKNNLILDKKKQLGDLNYRLALIKAENQSSYSSESSNKITQLENETQKLNEEIKQGIDQLYSYQNSIDGLPVSKLLPDWMNNVVESENLKAKLSVLKKQNNDFEETYARYAPAGANMKRLEREISVAEQGYLEILHGLNLAKLKLQDSELSSDLKPIDVPYYPVSPNPTKRAILIIAAAFLGGILTLGIIFVMEYFDDSLKNSHIASKKIGFLSLGMVPKIVIDPGSYNLNFIKNRLIEIVTQNIFQFFGSEENTNKTKIIVVFSTQKLEGKTVTAGNIAKTFKKEGKKVLLLNYKQEQITAKEQGKSPILNKILGYPDPRIAVDDAFLADVSNYLSPSEHDYYDLNNDFFNAKNHIDILNGINIRLKNNLDFIIIEIPAIIYSNYPTELMVNADLNILVCRANRTWSTADKSAIRNLKEACGEKINIIVNGVNINEVESMLGDLPRRRSKFRKKIKALFKFQFLSKNQI